MCDACFANETILIESIIPGFTLTKYSKDYGQIKAGSMGLVEINEPTFMWPKELIVIDPLFGINENEISEDDPRWIGCSGFYHAAHEFSVCLTCHPMAGYRLVNACMEAGYNIEEHGYSVSFWLLGYIASRLEELK